MSDFRRWCVVYTVASFVVGTLMWCAGKPPSAVHMFLITFGIATGWVAMPRLANPDYRSGRKPHQPVPGVYDPIQHARNLGEL